MPSSFVCKRPFTLTVVFFVEKSTYVTRASSVFVRISLFFSLFFIFVTNKYLASTFQKCQGKTNGQRAPSAFSARMSSIEKEKKKRERERERRKKKNLRRPTNPSCTSSRYRFPFILIRMSDIGYAVEKREEKQSQLKRWGETNRTGRITKEKRKDRWGLFKNGRGCTW